MWIVFRIVAKIASRQLSEDWMLCFGVQMQAQDHDTGVNGQLSYSVIYTVERNHVFDVRPHPDKRNVAVLYTLRSFDRESSSSYGAITYEGKVTLQVIFTYNCYY